MPAGESIFVISPSNYDSAITLQGGRRSVNIEKFIFAYVNNMYKLHVDLQTVKNTTL